MSVLQITKNVAILTAVTVLFWGSAALAQGNPEADSEQEDEAAKAFRAAQELFARKEYLEAAAAFKQAYSLAPHPSVLANIGYCYDEAGDYPLAVEIYRKYLEKPNPDDPKTNEDVAKYLEKIQSKVGDLRINCFSGRCDMTVDSVPRGSGPIHLILPPGAHTVDVVSVDGSRARHYNVVVPRGGEIVLEVELTHPVDKSATDSRRLRAPFWIATGATAAGLVSVAVLGGLTNKVLKDFDQGGREDPNLEDRGKNLRLGTNIAIGLTSAAATMALVFAIIDIKRAKDKDGKGQRTSNQHRNQTATFAGCGFLGVCVGF